MNQRIEEEMEEKSAVTFMDIMTAIKKNLILVLVVTAIITIAGSLIINFVYNKSKQVYTSSFEMDFLTNSNGQYPDGTTYNFKDSISKDALNAIKTSDDSFKSIDVDAMILNDDISISYDEKTNSYTIKGKKKYFSDSKQAAKFFNEIKNYPINKTKGIVNNMNYVANITAYTECKTTYVDKLSYLTSQKSYLSSLYTKLMELSSENYMIVNDSLGELSGMTLNQLKLRLNNVLAINEVDYAKNTIEYNRLIINAAEYAKTAEIKIQLLLKEKSENTIKYDNLYDKYKTMITDVYGGTSYDASLDNAYVTELKSLASRNENISIEINNIQDTLDKNSESNPAHAALVVELEKLETMLETAKTALIKETEYAKIAMDTVYNEKANVYGENGVKQSGGLNIILGVLISLLIGFLLIAIIVCIKDLPKIMKEKELALKAERQSANE